jgi:hypothetical protein
MFKEKCVSRKNQYTYWLKYEAEDCGILQPPLNAQKALDFLKDYLLGENWYVVNPVNTEQCNAQIVHEILYYYSSKYRREYKRAMKRGTNK